MKIWNRVKLLIDPPFKVPTVDIKIDNGIISIEHKSSPLFILLNI